LVSVLLQGLIRELLDYNLRRGTAQVRMDVRRLLCLLTRDNVIATTELNTLLTHRIVTAIQGHLSNPDFVSGTGRLLTASFESSHSFALIFMAVVQLLGMGYV